MKSYWRGYWLVKTGGIETGTQLKLRKFRRRKEAFESVGLDASRFIKPEIRGNLYPGYERKDMLIFPFVGHEHGYDYEFALYDIPL